MWPTDTFGLCWIGLFWLLVSAPLFINAADLVSRRKNFFGTTYLRMSALYFFQFVLSTKQLCCDFFYFLLSNCFSGRTAKAPSYFSIAIVNVSLSFLSWMDPDYLHVLLQVHSTTGLSTPTSGNLGGLCNHNGFIVYVESQFLRFNSAQSSAHVLSPICFLQTTEDKELFAFAKLANR